MADKVQQIYDYFSPDNPGLGNLNEFKSALQDSSKRRQFYDHFSPDNPGFGTFDEFEQNVLPTPTDTATTTPPVIPPTPPKKEEKQPEPIKQYRTDPAVYLAVADMEAGDRATRHNNFSAHIVPDDPGLRQQLIDSFGMEVGDSLPNNPNLFTAKYPGADTGKAAGEFIIDKVWAENDGDVEKFVEQYSGLDPASDEYQTYLGTVQDQVKNSMEAQDLELKELVADVGFDQFKTTSGFPPKADRTIMPLEEFDAMVGRNLQKQEERAEKKRYQQNLQTVFGFNNTDSGGIKVDENDPEVKNIMAIRESVDFDTTMNKYNVAYKYMNDKWGVISKQNYGQIPANRAEEYYADLDTFQTVADTARNAKDQVVPLIQKHNERVIADHNAFVEERIKATESAMMEMGFAAKAGTPEAEKIWADYQTKVKEQGIYVEGMGYTESVPEPKFYTDKDIEIYRAQGWTTGYPLADRAIQGIAQFTTGVVGAAEFLTDNPVMETGFNMFYNNNLAPARWILGEENVPLARNQLGELMGLADARDFQPLDVLDEVTAVTSEYAQKYRRGANAYYDNQGFWDLASAGEFSTAGHYMVGQLIAQAPQIASVMYGGYALQSPRLATMLLSTVAGGAKYKELEAEGMPYLKTIPYVFGEALIEYATERFGTEKLMRGLLNNRVAKEEITDGIQSVFRQGIKGFGSEGTEELVAGLAQPLKDRFIDFGMNGDSEGLKTYIKDMIEDYPNLIEQFAVGGLSGSMMMGGGTLANNMTINKQFEKAISDHERAKLE